jgi:tetratricopeptide (TPR) repeat protein
MRSLVLSLVVAAVLAVVIASLLWFAQSVPPAVAAADLSPRPPAATVQHDAGPLASPHELESAAGESAPVASASEAEAPRTEIQAAPFDLVEELRHARERGLVREGDVTSWLAFAYLRGGDPHGALALLERCDSKDANAWWNVAQMLANSGDRVAQERALSRALALMPENQAFVASLAQIDPSRAVGFFRAQLAQQEPPGDPELRKQLAQSLANMGHGAEAQVLLAGILNENPEDVEALRLLGLVDPVGATARIEELMAKADDPSGWRTLLANLYIERGDFAAAERLIASAERAGQTIAPEEWGQVADTLMETGKTSSAVEAWSRAIALEHGDPDQWVNALTQYAPDKLVSLLEMRVRSDEVDNDEYWGSLADAYWRAGRKLDAQGAWERARSLDPKDDEWPMRLAAIAAGEDPYQ